MGNILCFCMLFPPLSCPQTSLAAAELGASSLAWLGAGSPRPDCPPPDTVHSTTVQLQLLRKAFTQHTTHHLLLLLHNPPHSFQQYLHHDTFLQGRRGNLQSSWNYVIIIINLYLPLLKMSKKSTPGQSYDALKKSAKCLDSYPL